MDENYIILGVPETASDEEVQAAYEQLKRKYNEEKWQDGEAGTNAARMLSKLETAYAEIMADRREKRRGESGSAFDELISCIRSGDLVRAQAILDSFNERNAEWHFLQAAVYYKKNWINESKKQVEIAMKMDPNEPKYKREYDRLCSRTQYQEQTGGTPAPEHPAGEQMGGNWCASCASMCYTFLCVNLVFNLCCSCR